MLHNDLKCNNVLIANHGDSVKFCDFGWSTALARGSGDSPSSQIHTNSLVFRTSYRGVKPPLVNAGPEGNYHYWTTPYTGTKLSGWDVDFYAFIQLCVTVLFHDDEEFVTSVRTQRQFPPRDRLEKTLAGFPHLEYFFSTGQRFLDERAVVFDTAGWNEVGGLFMKSFGGN